MFKNERYLEEQHIENRNFVETNNLGNANNLHAKKKI